MKTRLVRGLVRLPSDVLEALGWREGMVVRIEADGDKVVIRPAFPTSCTGWSADASPPPSSLHLVRVTHQFPQPM